MIYFDVIGDPVAAPRPRAVAMGKDHGGRDRVRMYVPSSADAWKHRVRAAAVEALAGHRLFAPGVAVEVHLAFRLARPKSHLRGGKSSALLKAGAPCWHVQRPDRDNLEKAVLDALGDFAGLTPLVWCDDCQVVAGRTSKRWAAPGESPGVTVAIWEFQE